MKKFSPVWKLACLAAVSALIVSCGGGADYRNVLPADAFVTMSVNSASLVEKSGACDAGRNPLLVRVKAELEKSAELSAEEKEYLFSLLENPGESGLDLKKDLFVFMSMEGGTPQNPDMSFGLLFPVGDRAKLDALIARVNEKSGTEAVTEGGVSVVKIGEEAAGSGVCAYNDAALMLYFVSDSSRDIEDAVRALFAQKQGESLMGDKAAAAQLSERNDINVVMSYAGMAPMMNNPMVSSMPVMDALKGAMMLGSANFEKGRVVFDAAMVYKDKASEQKMADFYAYVKPQTGDLLRYVSANCIGAVSYGLDGEKLYAMLAAMPGYGMMVGNPMVKQVLDAFDGDLLVSFSGMTADGRYPMASLLAQVKDPAVLQTIVANLAGMPVQQTGEGAYSIGMGGVTVSFGVEDKVLYVTTDAIVKSALDGAEIESLASRAQIFKGQSGTFYLDFGGLNTLIARMTAGNDTLPTEIAISVLGIFDNLEACGTMDGGKAVVNMADKEQNSLKSICDMTRELIGRYAPEANL